MPSFDKDSRQPSIIEDETESNKKGASTPLSKYLKEIQAYQRESMSSLYTHAVDRPCLGGCENNEMIDLDLFLSCRQPLSFLPFVNHDNEGDGDSWSDPMPVAGAYTIPTDCEYCGARHVSECSAECQRPRLFFQKKRPPFCHDDKKWDSVTEFSIEPPKAAPAENEEDFLTDRKSPLAWVNEIFGKNQTTTSTT